MSPPVQAALAARHRVRHLRGGALLALAGTLAGCAGGPDLDRLAADRTLTTSSISRSEAAAPRQPDLDQMAIRDAVGSADLARIDGAGIPWASAVTGVRGTVTAVAPHREQGMDCRRYTATRESYDGVTIVHGNICLGPSGQWAMLEFAEG